jgi:hypothetical protein
MIGKSALAAAIFISVSAPALACMRPPAGAVRAQEIVLLNDAIKNFKLAPEELGRIKAARDRAEALYEAGKYDEAETTRRSALTQLGYQIQPSTARGAGCPGDTYLAPAR